MYDLIILGGGPAGLTAAVYAAAKRLDALLVSPDLGGKAHYRMRLEGRDGYETIPGEETVRQFQAQVAAMDFCRLDDRAASAAAVPGPGSVERFTITTAGGRIISARALIVATGARPRVLGLPREEALWGHGLTYSAVSHAQLYWDRDVAVAGGGDLALRSALELASIARRVVLVAPSDLCGDERLVATLAGAPNVEVLTGHRIVGLGGDPFLEAITVQSPGEEVFSLSVTGLFVALDLSPVSEPFRALVALNARGEVVVDARGATSRPGVFAAGDVTDSFSEQVLIALGDGARAALAAWDYLVAHPRHEEEPEPELPGPRPEQDW
jgi:NADH-dependent peroxiredoxin subunit F